MPHSARKVGQKTLHVMLTRAHDASFRVPERIEEIFCWAKTTGCFRMSRSLGVERAYPHGQYSVAA